MRGHGQKKSKVNAITFSLFCVFTRRNLKCHFHEQVCLLKTRSFKKKKPRFKVKQSDISFLGTTGARSKHIITQYHTSGVIPKPDALEIFQ